MPQLVMFVGAAIWAAVAWEVAFSGTAGEIGRYLRETAEIERSFWAAMKAARKVRTTY